jgi:hypothetical protein
MKRLFGRLRIKFKLWLRNVDLIKTHKEVSGYETKAMAICRKLINHPNSKFTIAPLSQKKYIVNKPLGLFIIIDGNKVEITNHVYHYVINLSNVDALKIIRSFNNKVECERNEYESEIKSNIQNTLNKILDKIMSETDGN